MALRPSNIVIVRLAALVLAVAVVSIANVRLGTLDVIGLLVFASGATVYLTLIKLGSADRQGRIDYLRSGEAAVATLVVFILTLLVTENVFALLGAVMLAFVAYNVARRVLVGTHRRAQAIAGVITLVVCAAVLAHLFSSISVEPARLAGALPALGLPHAFSGALYLLPLFMALSGAALYLFSRSLDEVAAFTQGARYFELTGGPFLPVALLLIVIRSAFTAIVFLCLGWTAGTGAYLQRRMNAGSLTDDVTVGLAVLLYAHLIALTMPLAGPIGTIAIATLLSHVAYAITAGRGNMS